MNLFYDFFKPHNYLKTLRKLISLQKYAKKVQIKFQMFFNKNKYTYSWVNT